MIPALLLLLLLLAAARSAAPDAGCTGKDFIVAFPEIIASYHPDPPTVKVQVTAMADNSKVTITLYNSPPAGTLGGTQEHTLAKGQTREFPIDASMELSKSGRDLNKTVHISSTEDVTVHAVSSKAGSLQTALVLPTHKLVSEYLIPPVPAIEGTTAPADIVTSEVTERRPFSLVIINGDKPNTVTVTGAASSKFPLQPFQIKQLVLEASAGLRSVACSEPVAVLFGHACAMRQDCTCGQLYTALPPPRQDKLKFFIPPVLAPGVKAFVLLSEAGSTKVEPYDPDSPLVKTAGSAILYHPGLLLSLVPEADFASCFVVSPVADTQSYATILVHKDATAGVRLGSSPLDDPDWEELKKTEYKTTRVTLQPGTNVIWHTSSKMGVYFMGHRDNVYFGNPAPVVSKVPDFRGCVLSPEVVRIGAVAVGWRESLKYCRDDGMQLVGFPEAELQNQIYEKIRQANNENVPEVWFSMRRSALTGAWYWLSGAPVSATNWLQGEPGSVHAGQCAMLSLQEGREFGWSDEDCCKAARPVCYRAPVLLNI